MKDRGRATALHVGVFLAYLLLTLVMTYPVVARLTTHLIGTGDDMWVQYWNNWWVKKKLVEGGSVYETRLLFYPQAVSLVYHNFSWVNIAASLLIEPLVGSVAAYNLVYLANVTLSAYAMFALARHLLKSDGPAFLAGLVYGCWPYRLSDYDHPNMVSTQWLPLVVLCVVLLVREGRDIRYALLGGVFLALTGLSRWQMLLPTAIAVGVYLAFSVLFERRHWSWRVAGMVVLMVVVGMLLVAIPFYPLAREMVAGRTDERLYTGEEVVKQTDLVAYFVPPVNHPLASLFGSLSYVHSPVRFSYSAFMGYTVLVMVVVAALGYWRTARLWLVLALVAFLLALGPVLRIDGHFYPSVPMPYRLVGWLAPLRWMRYPHRFNVLLALPVAILTGYGAIVLRDRLARERPVLLWGVLSLLILFDYLNLPAATVPVSIPDFYGMLSQGEDEFAVLDLPLGRDKGDCYMFYQTVHGHPIVEGNTARPQTDHFAFINESPLLHALRERETFSLNDPSRQLEALADAGIRYVVVHKSFAQPGQLEAWRSFLPLLPAYEDDAVLVYRSALEFERDFEFTAELGDGIGLISGTLSTGVLAQDGVLEAEWSLGTSTAPTRVWAARLALVSAAGEVAQAVEGEPCADWPTSEWGEDAVARGQAALQVDPFLGGGLYTVTLALVDPAGKVAGRAASLGQVEVQVVERVFEEPEVALPLEVVFGDALRLVGYDLQRDADELVLTLYWQALHRMGVAYKMFVHLLDLESGEVVTQADVMPRGWTYPTTWWEAGEVVSDQINLSLASVPLGAYRLAIGVYDSHTGERLSIADQPNYFTVVERQLILSEEVVR